ncbi:MAG: hypothetical protein NTZ05_00160 [Chloroflexi bacterium]|nr:hypothetical protein [Chloroflexota bacterium]
MPTWAEVVQASTLYRRAQANPAFWADQEDGYRRWLAHNDYVAKLAAALEPRLRPADRVLDVGGGSGALALALAPKTRLWTVVEPSAALCRRLLDAAAASGTTNIAILPAPLEALHEGFGFVETSLAAQCFETIPNPAPLLVKLFKCTRRNILIAVGGGNPHPLQQEVWRRFRDADYPAPPGLEEMLRLLRDEVGFRPIVETIVATDTLVYRDLDDAVEQWTAELSEDAPPPDVKALRRFLQVWLVPLPPPEGQGPGTAGVGVRSMTQRALITCYPGE